MTAVVPQRPAAMPEPAAMLPRPSELAALGTVLCLYRARSGGELAGWSQAVRAEACTAMDSDGLRERLSFYGRDGRCCWRLCLLPDSDFLAWERLAAALPAPHPAVAGIAERLWRGLAGKLSAPPWQCSVLRLHAPNPGPGFGFAGQPLLAASLTTVSALGAAVARRIAHEEGAGNAATLDECCCERAALAARLPIHAGASADAPLPIVRLDTRPNP